MTSTARRELHWKELDTLRGMAAIMMIVNHAGFRMLMPDLLEAPLPKALIYLSSCAPVIFFLATGIGYGLQSTRKSAATDWVNVLNKFAILIIADLLIRWSEGQWLGLDFLGFIAISCLVLEWIRQSRAPWIFSAIGIVLVIALRFLIGPSVQGANAALQVPWLINWILGTKETPGISYPCSPWMVYPLAGYLIGASVARSREWIDGHRPLAITALLAIAVVFGLMSWVLAERGASFHRWSTMGIGFFVASFSVIASCMAVALALHGGGQLASLGTAVELRGIASLAIVPIHYLLIYLAVMSGVVQAGLQIVSWVTLGLVLASFQLARGVEMLSERVRRAEHPSRMWARLAIALLVSAALTLLWGTNGSSIAMLPRTVGQITLCLLFGAGLPKMRARADEAQRPIARLASERA